MAIDGIGKRQADITKISGGLERKNLKNDQERSIFDAMDTDHNGILTDEEINKFKHGDTEKRTQGVDVDNDGVITKKEAKKFIKANGLKDLDVKKQDVIDFLKKYGVYANNATSAEVTDEGIVVTYDDASKKIVNPQTKDYKIVKQDTNNTSNTTTSYNSEDVLLNEVVNSENEVVTTTFRNGDRASINNVVKEDLTNNTKTVISYDDTGKKILEEVMVNSATNEETLYAYENGVRIGKKVVKGTTETNYIINGDTEVKTSMIENKGIDAIETHTKWTYNDDKTITEDITCEGQKLHTVNTLNEENHRLSQTKTVGETTYNATYDGQGNTTGIVIQRGETAEQLAAKFNCSVEDLKKLNEGVEFKPGSTIKVPNEIDADDERLQNRKSPEEIQSEIKHEQDVARQQRLAAQRARQQAEAAQLKKLGLLNRKGAGQKVKAKYSNKKEEEFTVIGQASFNRVIARRKNGDIVVLSHDHGGQGRVVLKTERVVNTETFRTGKKVNVGGREVVITEQSRDAHGRMVAVDAQGRTVIVSGGNSRTDLSDRKIVSASYATASDVADIYNDEQKRTEALNNGTMHLSVVNGEKIVYTRGADGKLWAFKIGANGKLINQGAVSVNKYLDIDANHIKNTRDFAQVKYPEMKVALDRVCEEDYSDTRSADGLTGLSPSEQYILEESSTRSEGRQDIRTIANAGGYGSPEATSAAIGRVCANEVEYELHGGNTMLGLINTTHEADVSDAMKLCTSRADRLAAEQSIHAIHPELAAEEGSYMRAAIGDETGKIGGYRTAAADRVMVSWIESGAYEQAQYLKDDEGNLILDEHGNPQLDPNSLGDQETINAMTERMMFGQYYTTDSQGNQIRIEGYRNFEDDDYRLSMHNLMGAIEGSRYNSETYLDEHGTIMNPAMDYFRGRCADYVTQNKITPNVTDELPEETFIVNMSTSTHTGKIDMEHVGACNRLLYGDYRPNIIKAEECVLNARETGNQLNLFQSDDPKVYEELSLMAANGDLGPNVMTLGDVISQMHGRPEEFDMALARAHVYAGLDIPNMEECALRIADRIDMRAHGGSAAGGLEGQEIRIEEEILFRDLAIRIAQDDPAKIQKLRAAIQDRNYKKGTITLNYNKILDEAEYIGTAKPEFDVHDENYAYNRRHVTDPAEIEAIKAQNLEALSEFSNYVENLGVEFQKKVDGEGKFSDFADGFRDAGNMGNTRRSYRNLYRQTREMQRRLDLAAQGLLRNSQGTVITFEQEAARCKAQLEALAQASTDYDEAQEYTKMAIVLAPIVIATAPVATTGVATTAAVMGGSTAVIEGGSMLLEHETATITKGTRGEVLTDAAVRATEDAALGAAIPGVGKVAQGIAKGTKYVKKVARARRINNIRANRLHSMPAPVEHVNLHGTRMNPEGVHINVDETNAARRAYVTPESNTINISDLEVQLNEAEISNTLRQNYDDFLRNDVMDRSKVREMIIKTHSDKGGSDELFIAVDELNQAIKEGNIARARNAKDNLRTLLEQKSAKLDTYREQMKVYREAQATGTAPHTKPTVAPHTEPTAAPHTEPPAAPHAETPTPTVKPNETPIVETPAPRRPYSEPTIREIPIENNQILHADAPTPAAKPVEAPRVETPVVTPAGNVNYNQKILKLNNLDDVKSLRAEINASEKLSKKEKKILNDILNEKETALRARQLKPGADVSVIDDEVRIVDDEVRIVDDVEVSIADDEAEIIGFTPAEESQRLSAKYQNVNSREDFIRLMEEEYSNIRDANYSDIASAPHGFPQDMIGTRDSYGDLFLENNPYNIKVQPSKQGEFVFRYKKGMLNADEVVDRISLNVTADRQLLNELDELLTTGKYVNSKGQVIEFPHFHYKTSSNLKYWQGRQDPITMYFSDELTPEMTEALAEMSQKYARPSIEGKPLQGALNRCPWIGHEAYIKPEQAEALWREACELNENLGSAIAEKLHQDKAWNCSTGNYNACKKIVEEYKVLKPNSVEEVFDLSKPGSKRILEETPTFTPIEDNIYNPYDPMLNQEYEMDMVDPNLFYLDPNDF